MKKTHIEIDLDRYKAFFFDFDGVIADSVDIKTEAFRELYRPYGEKAVRYVTQHHKEHGGMSRFLKIRHYHKELLDKDLSDDELKLLTDKFSDLVLKKVVKTSFISGAEEFIRILHAKHKKMFIVSGTPEEEIQRIIQAKNFGNYFLEVRGAPVTKKDNLQYLLEKYQIPAHQSVFFGDSPEDLNAASSLGIRFIAINFCSMDIKGYRDFVDFMDKEIKEVKGLWHR